jgi:DNA-binding IclR family transcriptional regulator
MAALNKALDILCLFDRQHTHLAAREIASILKIPLSSTYRCLELVSKPHKL